MRNLAMRLSILDIAAEGPVLAGAIPGSNLRAKIIPKLALETEVQPLFLDFKGIEVATSSYLQQGILELRDHCRKFFSHLYPVVANATDYVTEELERLLRYHSEAILTCKLDARGKISAVRVLGVLEEKQELTLEAVKSLGVVNATILMQKSKEKDPIGVTGWNNRLSGLASKGLLMETKKGRTKIYQLVLEM
jgi:hypothetical protein